MERIIESIRPEVKRLLAFYSGFDGIYLTLELKSLIFRIQGEIWSLDL